MAFALRPLPRRLLRSIHCSNPLSTSTSASPHDVHELLRIQRILNPATTTHSPQNQEHPRATTDLHDLLHRTAGLTAAEATSFLRGIPNTDRLGRLLRELRGLRLHGDEIKNALESDPDGLLSMDPGEPSRLVELLDGLRCRGAVKDRVLSHGVLWAAIAARQRVELLHAHGLNRRDALRVLSVEPRAILYDLEDVERKLEFLVNRMGFEIGWLVEYPEFLGVNLDRWIIPRHNVLEYLASVGGLGDPIEMKHYVRFSRQQFYNMFVKPYPECERIFGGLVRERKNEVRRWHPVGLWKLFKPTKHESTEEDVKNMKFVVESLH
ncbi:transcription termination factor MTERF15, mitochondrial [Brachypodium distachyon]|uniref:Transcription termination factor MTERF15, mitochondrial n=1 Tax=Brachypodium distachyon TaxID=15368 RepID=A0A0Q3IKD6_BRADI|nr:transcription termination factor MTERF15, mitochondrial [Brachypodium distachyon]XP_014757347.1 transcription termination factor MTERF15, mitochondrial [Brachypodium distachyon]XP_024318489.1 transcription termination factor MTERF15, mitochondrial [Brachypodium distachyon]XP_024318490.1 transcription termination factor MTERF15, mitochondrial [Brachypodium distachyon]XP_024318491.1 transcription termination factor MTERF15, mitochondrial [Brachypodium distachyon]XP_024318492.1 transcription t|eukprot:XP_014757344.1 transcription termination factor MTERF15, mitochondrial [Brachypodium distachyon]